MKLSSSLLLPATHPLKGTTEVSSQKCVWKDKFNAQCFWLFLLSTKYSLLSRHRWCQKVFLGNYRPFAFPLQTDRAPVRSPAKKIKSFKILPISPLGSNTSIGWLPIDPSLPLKTMGARLLEQRNQVWGLIYNIYNIYVIVGVVDMWNIRNLWKYLGIDAILPTLCRISAIFWRKGLLIGASYLVNLGTMCSTEVWASKS